MTTRHSTGTRVFHASYGRGIVAEPTGHTHPDFERVTFDRKGFTLRVPIKAVHVVNERDELSALDRFLIDCIEDWVNEPSDPTGLDCWEAYE